MLQVWLTFVAFVFAYYGVVQQKNDRMEDVCVVIAACFIALGFILFFVNGGTTG